MDRPTHRTTDDAFSVPWAIAAAALAEPVDALDLSQATRSPAPHAHCSACQGKRIDALVTPDGASYLRCRGCHRLWRVQAKSVQLVVPADASDHAPEAQPQA